MNSSNSAAARIAGDHNMINLIALFPYCDNLVVDIRLDFLTKHLSSYTVLLPFVFSLIQKLAVTQLFFHMGVTLEIFQSG